MKNFIYTKWFKALLYSGVFILFLAGTLLAVSKHFEPKLKKEIKEAFFKATKGLYHIEFKHINTNILLGNATIKDVVLKTNWHVYDSLASINQAPDNLYELTLKNIKIKGFEPYNLFKTKSLNIKNIRFENPKITLYHHAFDYNRARKLAPKESLYLYIEKYLTNISIEAVKLQNIDFTYIDRDSSFKNKTFKNFQVQLLNWKLNKNTQQDNNRFYYFEDAIFTLPNYHFKTKNELYEGSWNNVSLLFKEKKIHIQSFNIHPTLNIDQFQKKLGFSKISVETTLEDIHLDSVDMLAFLRKGNLLVKKLWVSSGKLNLKNGKGFVKNLEEKSHVIPNELLQKLPIPIKIENILLNNIDVNYQEYSKKSNKSGLINFSETCFNMTNVTNMRQLFTKNSKMHLKVDAKIMDIAPFNFDLDMYYGTPQGEFTINGNVGKVNGKIFNQIAAPLGLITIKSLNVKSMHFYLKGNNQNLKGNMRFLYDNLSISIMKKDEESGKIARKGLLSIFANNWVLETQNPRLNGKTIQAPIAIQRAPNYGFTKYIWVALKQGIKYSVGITPEKENNIQKKIRQFHTLKENFESYKEQLKKQRAENKLRREKRDATKNN